MAFCAFCGKEISDRAPVCPNCGHPQGPAAPGTASGGAQGRTEGNAIASLILGIAAFVVCPLIPAILAVVFGNKAKQNIANDPSLEGEGLAKAGVILGWINIGLSALVVVLIVAVAAVGGFAATL